jgi:hypothetical protein
MRVAASLAAARLVDTSRVYAGRREVTEPHCAVAGVSGIEHRDSTLQVGFRLTELAEGEQRPACDPFRVGLREPVDPIRLLLGYRIGEKVKGALLSAAPACSIAGSGCALRETCMQ